MPKQDKTRYNPVTSEMVQSDFVITRHQVRGILIEVVVVVLVVVGSCGSCGNSDGWLVDLGQRA